MALIILPASAGPSVLRFSTPDVKKQVVAAVEIQLAAFRNGDAEQAYSLLALPVRAQIPLRRFLAIMQASYPEIWRNRRADFGLVRDDGTRAVVLVEVASPQGDATFEYVLVRERNEWRVGSVSRHHPGRKADA